MHELPEPLVTMLRAQGISDAELDELRTTGSIERGGPTGSIHLELAHPGAGSAPAQAINVGGTTMGPGEIPPEALEKLRRFHTFMPKAVVHQIETESGHDFDGDGIVGAPAAAPRTQGMPNALASANARAAHHNMSGAMPGQGPFVEKSPAARLVPVLLLIAVLAGALYYFVR